MSLLGTWQGEPWIPNVSTLYQVFVSIYGLIFVDEPYFNEPGYQNTRGTPVGDAANAAYNSEQRYKTVELSMVDAIKKPTPEFAAVIHEHFTLRQETILTLVREWKEKNNKLNSGKYKNMTTQLTALEKQIKKLK